nr:glycosyltransferase family 4 protein [uncultured Bacteroides sp.]
MKTILFLNNYDMSQSRKLYLQGNSPSHHQFGTSELIDTGKYTVDYMLAAPKAYKNRIFKLLSLIPAWIRIYRKARKYDIVYGAADFTVDFLGMAKKVRLFRPKLIAIFHHPPFEQRLSVERFDKIIFLSQYAQKEMSTKFPQSSASMVFMQWGPDKAFYSNNISVLNYQKEQKELIFISNGKTHRDHETLITAAEETKNKTIIVSDEWSLPSNYNEDCVYAEIYYQNKPDDRKMIELLNRCSVLVIPTANSSRLLGPIGLTSFLDAVALGMPIITASNTVFADIVKEKQLGFVFQAGNLEELKNTMNLFNTNPELISEYGKNAYDFGEKNDIKVFGRQLQQIIEQL